LNKWILVVEIFGEKFPENCTEFGSARMGTSVNFGAQESRIEGFGQGYK
jgi:hypothetical protein